MSDQVRRLSNIKWIATGVDGHTHHTCGEWMYTSDAPPVEADEYERMKQRAEDAEAIRQVYAAMLVAGMREVVRLSNAPDKIATATAYYAKLFELAQEFGMLDKCNEAAIAAVAKRVDVPIEYTRV